MGKLIDLTGQRFGKLVVIERDFERQKELKSHSVYWRCQCDCGNQKSVQGSALKTGHVRSCGCLRRDLEKDLTGKRFGKLIVLEKAEGYAKEHGLANKNHWKCQCDCGNIIYPTTGNLTSGNVLSCGCSRKGPKPALIKDLTNQRFGKLIALYPTEKRSHNNVIWHCKCDCGRECEVRSSCLQDGTTSSCGCITSVGELNIRKLLTDNNIEFQTEKTFSNFIYKDTKRHPKYDFYLPDFNRLIEFDGSQHYKPSGNSNIYWFTQEKVNEIQQKDKIKNKYALNNGYDLVRIPYWERDKITLEMLLGDTYLINKQEEIHL